MKKLGIVVFSIFLLTNSALGVSSDDRKSINNDTVFYGKEDLATSCDSDSVNLTGSDNQEKAFNFFISKGLTPKQSAGIVGNLIAESGVDPKKQEIGKPHGSLNSPLNGTGYGIAQWTFTARQQPLVDYANSKNLPVSSLEAQLGYLWKEFNTAYYKPVLKDLMKTTSEADASYIFLSRFEIPEDIAGQAPIRARNAADVLRLYGDGGGSTATRDEGCGGAIADANIAKYNPSLPTTGNIKPTAVVLHWWGGNAPGDRGIKALEDALRGNNSCGGSGCSVQLGILKDGKTYLMTKSLTSRAIHATCSNDSAIGLENEGMPEDFGASGPTKRPEQFAAIVATTKYLMDKYDIPLDGDFKNGRFTGVFSHKQVDRMCKTGNKPDVDDEYLSAVKKALKDGGNQ